MFLPEGLEDSPLKSCNKSKTKNIEMLNTFNFFTNGEKMKTKGLMFFVSFFSCDLQDFKS